MQGYVAIATGAHKYLEMAVNLALSIRHFDLDRPIALVHDAALGNYKHDLEVFDETVLLEPIEGLLGCANKVRLFELSPFHETMFVDADCLMTRAGVELYWRALAEYDFNMTGDKRTVGRWNNMVIPKVLEHFDIPYVVQMNSGVFYFKKGPEAKTFFDCVLDLAQNHAAFVSYEHKGVGGQIADEPLFGTSMGICGIEPLAQQGEHSWMVSTWRASNFELDDQTLACTFDKGADFLFGLPFLPRRKVRHSPVFTHFIGLRPRSVYDRICRALRKELPSVSSAS